MIGRSRRRRSDVAVDAGAAPIPPAQPGWREVAAMPAARPMRTEIDTAGFGPEQLSRQPMPIVLAPPVHDVTPDLPGTATGLATVVSRAVATAPEVAPTRFPRLRRRPGRAAATRGAPQPGSEDTWVQRAPEPVAVHHDHAHDRAHDHAPDDAPDDAYDDADRPAPEPDRAAEAGRPVAATSAAETPTVTSTEPRPAAMPHRAVQRVEATPPAQTVGAASPPPAVRDSAAPASVPPRSLPALRPLTPSSVPSVSTPSAPAASVQRSAAVEPPPAIRATPPPATSRTPEPPVVAPPADAVDPAAASAIPALEPRGATPAGEPSVRPDQESAVELPTAPLAESATERPDEPPVVVSRIADGRTGSAPAPPGLAPFRRVRVTEERTSTATAPAPRMAPPTPAPPTPAPPGPPRPVVAEPGPTAAVTRPPLGPDSGPGRTPGLGRPIVSRTVATDRLPDAPTAEEPAGDAVTPVEAMPDPVRPAQPPSTDRPRRPRLAAGPARRAVQRAAAERSGPETPSLAAQSPASPPDDGTMSEAQADPAQFLVASGLGERQPDGSVHFRTTAQRSVINSPVAGPPTGSERVDHGGDAVASPVALSLAALPATPPATASSHAHPAELMDELYERLHSRLRADLLYERERSGSLSQR